MKRGLLDMPGDVMGKIMKDVGIKSIFTLRKVCHDLRNFIDDIKPEANWLNIQIIGNKNDITAKYGSLGIDIRYLKHEEGCKVVVEEDTCSEDNLSSEESRQTEFLLKNEDFINVSMKDLELVLRHQKSILEHLYVFWIDPNDMENQNLFFDRLKYILEGRDRPLKVQAIHISLDGGGESQIMSVLPFLDSEVLEEIFIQNQRNNNVLEIDEVVKLDQWKKVRSIHCGRRIDVNFIQHFNHFSEVDVITQSNLLSDLVWLKQICLNSSQFKTIWLYYTQADPNFEERLQEILGEAIFYLESNNWFYRLQDTDEEVLEIVHRKREEDHPCFCLTRSRLEYVPPGAVIQN